jgi:hypothetical protein
MTLFVIFALGYAIGGVSALLLIGLMRASRNSERPARGVVVHDT